MEKSNLHTQNQPVYTVAIADDHELIRQAMVLMLENMALFKVVAQASNGHELIRQLESLNEKPHLALIDISMPVMDGYETLKWLSEHMPEIRCVPLSVESRFEAVFRMISSGAKAYLLKDCSPKDMKQTLLQVMEQGFYYDSFVVDSLTAFNRSADKQAPSFSKDIQLINQLSDREKEFIVHCCSELAYKEIAALMNVSPRTIDGYREAVFSKLDLKSRIGIVLFALRNGMFKPVQSDFP